MRPKYLVPVAMVIAAFLGGATMQWLSSPPDALAAEPATRPVVESLQVRELALVDEAGRQRAILRMEPDGPQFLCAMAAETVASPSARLAHPPTSPGGA